MTKITSIIIVILVIAFVGCSKQYDELNDTQEIYKILFNDAKEFYSEISIYPKMISIPFDKSTAEKHFKLNRNLIDRYNELIQIDDIGQIAAQLGYSANESSKYKVTNIIYDKKHLQAIVYEEDNRIPLAGHGMLYLFEKVNGKWILSQNYLYWIS